MPQILLVQPADAPQRAAALAAQLGTPGGWSVTTTTPHGLAGLTPEALCAFDLVTLELSLATADRGSALKNLTATRGRGPVVVTAPLEAPAEALAAAVACGAAGLAVCDGHGRKALECAARVLGDADQETSRCRLRDCMTQSHSVFEIGCDPALLPALVNRLQDSLTMFCLCDSAERARIGIAVEEALSNGLYHGNLELDSKLREHGMDAFYALAAERRTLAPYRHRVLRVTEHLCREQATLTIRDQGPGFDTSRLALAPGADHEANLETPSGRGFMLMQAFMDEVSYNAAGNEITLVKRRTTATDEDDNALAA